MSAKRKSTMDEGRASKRPRSDRHGGDSRNEGYEIRSRVDPTTGQRGAFPGLDDDGTGEEEVFYAPAEDGLEYLRMVRAEAQTVPSVLIAKSSSQARLNPRVDVARNFQDADFERLWADEAIVATPTEDDYDDMSGDEDYEEEQDPQDAYYGALLERFSDLRHQLSNNVSLLKSAQGVFKTEMQWATDIHAKYRQWWFAFTGHAPTANYVAQLSQNQVILGLDRLESLLSRRNLDTSFCRVRLGAWSWALLAKCRDRTSVDGDDVGVLRALAKKAQMLHRKYSAVSTDASWTARAEEDRSYHEEMVEDGSESEGEHADDAPAVPEDLEAARAKLLSTVESNMGGDPGKVENREDSDPVGAILMLLDSIVTVVGELYGQRDLLEQRAAW